MCITPNMVFGPSDISQYFDTIPTGFHLKEYTIRELHILFKQIGFKNYILYAGGKGKYVRFPLKLALLIERILGKLPYGIRKSISRSILFKAILGINLVGIK